jgi:erythromycin esterase-like protein
MLEPEFDGKGKRRRRAAILPVLIALIAPIPMAPAQQPAPSPVTLANISTRMRVEIGDNALIGGFIITGNAPKKVILRAIGPSLSGAVPGALADPTLQLFQGGTSLEFNDNWKDSAERDDIEASTIPPGHDLESAIVKTLAPGAYTAVVRGKGDTTGVGLVELYDLDPGADSRLVNIATRGLVQPGDNAMIAGMIAVGPDGSSQRVLIRAIGPSLPMTGKLADPTLEVVNGNGTVLRSNDSWRNDQRAAIEASTIPPTNDFEAAIIATLQPGSYTAIVRGAGGSTGVALVEVYTLDNNYGVWPLAGDDPNLATTTDLEPLRVLIGDATVAAFGESYHTSGGLYRMKHRIFKFLVQEMGFRAFAIESNWDGAQLATAYVQTGVGTPEQAISQHINVWQGTEYAELVKWMADWNKTHPNPADKLTLYGFDIQQPTDDGPGLVDYLERIGIPKSDPRSSGISQCEGVNQNHPFGQIPPERHNACLQTLTSIENHFTANQADLVSSTSQKDFDIAMLRVVGLRAWENSVFTIAHDFQAGYNARDEGMAYAFNVMRAMLAPNAKTMVWADNSHVARVPLVRGEVPLGSYLANTFGNAYANFALHAFVTEVDYASCGPVARAPDSVEEALGPVLAKQGAPAMLVETRGSSILEPRVYSSAIFQLRPHLEYNGIIFMQHSPKFHPLLWAPCSN